MKTKTFGLPWPAAGQWPPTRRRGAAAALCAAALWMVANAPAEPVLDTLTGGPWQNNHNAPGYTDGNTFSNAQFNVPSGLALNSAGNLLYVADRINNAIRKVTITADVFDSQTFTYATTGVSQPIALAVDGGDNLYVLNRGNGANGTVQVFDRFGNLLGLRAASLANATAIALDGSTNIYVTVNGNSVVRISNSATNTVGVITNAGTSLRGIVVLDSGLLALSDAGNHGIWLLNPVNGTATALSGFNGAGDVFGTAGFAKFNQPEMIAKAGGSILVVADRGNHRVKIVDPVGTVTNLYGVASDLWVVYPDPSVKPGWWDGPACLDQGCAEAREPVGVLVAGNGDVYSTEVYYHLIRRTTSTGLAGPGGIGGGGGTNVVVVAPTVSPNSGYYPMGQSIIVNSPNPNVFYTTDGTTPTTNSARVNMNGNTGVIRWNNSTNDLTGLRVRAFIGTNASTVVSGQMVGLNDIGVPPGLHTNLLAGIGSTIVVPVVVDLRTNDQVMSYQFRVEVAPNGGAPGVSAQFRPLDVSTNDFVRVVTSAQGSTNALISVQSYSIGTTRGLQVSAIGTAANVTFKRFAVVAMLAIPIPGNAAQGQTYSISVLNASATADAAQTPVSLTAMTAAAILVTNVTYTVGDSSPGGWYGASEFGNGDLDNADVNNAFYAALGVHVPFTFTDVYDAMDSFPEDDVGFVGGDGLIRFLDWQVILQRSLRLPPYYGGTNNWMRALSFGGDRTNTGVTLPQGSPDGGGGTSVGGPWNRQVLLGAISVGNGVSGGQVDVPVYAKVGYGSTLAGLQFRAIITPDNGGPAISQAPQFLPAPGLTAPLTQNFPANELGVGWPLGSFSFASHSSNYVGRLRLSLPANAQAGQTYSVSFANADGAPDLRTQYDFETKHGTVAVSVSVPPSSDITSDDWKLYYFGSLASPDAQPNADPDHDSLKNWQEYIAGTDPTDALSRLQFERAITRVVSGQRQLVLRWLSAPGRLYEVVGADKPTGATWTVLGSVSGDGMEKEFVITNLSGAGRFYQVRVLP